jgi:hypothetical protein
MDFSKELQLMNKQHAIKGQVYTKLKDILPLLTKARLSSIAAQHNLSGRSTLNKDEIINRLYDHILEEGHLEAAILIANAKEWALFEQLVQAPTKQSDSLVPGTYLIWMNRGFLFSFLDQDKLVYVIPEEVKEAYLRMPKKAFMKKRERHQLVVAYINAVINLYGVCKPEKLIEIFNDQNDKKLTELEFMEIYGVQSGRERVYSMNRGYLIGDYFDYSTEEEFEELLERTKDKPYYVPDKAEFLKYSDSGYYENIPQLSQLKAFVLQNLCKDEKLVEYLVDDIQLACSMEAPMEEIMGEFERRGIHFQKKEQLQKLIPLLIDVCNHTRIWSNRGYTPNELGRISGRAVHEQAAPSNLLFFGQQAVSVKVGRNDPCTCGSGKKYKKCCGK